MSFRQTVHTAQTIVLVQAAATMMQDHTHSYTACILLQLISSDSSSSDSSGSDSSSSSGDPLS